MMPGEGDSVLWIHGYTLDSTSWSELWELLPDWRHIGIDLPGHGASMPLKPGDDLPTLARRLGRFALDQNVRHIVALSFGTIVALQIAIEFPRSFASVTLGAPAVGGGPQDPEVGARYDELAEMHRRHGFSPDLRRRWMESPPNLFKGVEALPEMWARLWRIVGRHGWWELADRSYARLGNCAQPKQALRRIAASVLVLVGENELPAFKRCAELIRREVPTCERIYLPGVGHLCMLENAAGIAPLIGRHLRAHTRTGLVEGSYAGSH
jgi:pimeloyl-ACP methyl ester carboxylesterase